MKMWNRRRISLERPSWYVSDALNGRGLSGMVLHIPIHDWVYNGSRVYHVNFFWLSSAVADQTWLVCRPFRDERAVCSGLICARSSGARPFELKVSPENWYSANLRQDLR